MRILYTVYSKWYSDILCHQDEKLRFHELVHNSLCSKLSKDIMIFYLYSCEDQYISNIPEVSTSRIDLLGYSNTIPISDWYGEILWHPWTGSFWFKSSVASSNSRLFSLKTHMEFDRKAVIIIITVSYPADSESTDVSPPCTVWHYRSANWEGLREFFSAFPWGQVCFWSMDLSDICTQVTEDIQISMERYIRHKEIKTVY